MIHVLAVAIFGVVLLQVGYLLQKVGVSAFSHHHSDVKGLVGERLFHIWVGGTLVTTAGSLLFFYSLTLGSLSVLQPIQGLGPMIIAFLVVVVLRDSLTPLEWAGVALSTLGLVLLPLFGDSSSSTLQVDELTLVLSSLFLVVVVGLLGFLASKLDLVQPGIFEGVVSGVLGGLASVYAKLGLTPLVESYSLHWGLAGLVLCQLVAFVILQRGFALGNVAKVATVFTSVSILAPVTFGVFLFGEVFHILSGLGVIAILAGAILLAKKNNLEVFESVQQLPEKRSST